MVAPMARFALYFDATGAFPPLGVGGLGRAGLGGAACGRVAIIRYAMLMARNGLPTRIVAKIIEMMNEPTIAYSVSRDCGVAGLLSAGCTAAIGMPFGWSGPHITCCPPCAKELDVARKPRYTPALTHWNAGDVGCQVAAASV